MLQGRGKQADLLALFDKANDVKSVIALKPKDFFVSSMNGMASQFRVHELKAIPFNVDVKIIGTVHEGDDLAYVVVRQRTKGREAEETKVEVVALKRSGTEWKMVLPYVVRVMAVIFQCTLQEKSGQTTVILPTPDK